MSYLTPDQIRDYHENGYIVVHDILTEAEVDAFVTYENEPKPEGWRQNLNHHKDNEYWAAIAKHPKMVSMVQQLMESSPQIVQTMYLEKKPAAENAAKSTGTAMHQDLHYLPCEPATLMACWVALSNTDAENGGLCVVPASNHGALHGTHRTANTDDHDSWEIEYLMRDQSGKEWTERMYSFEIDGLDKMNVQRLEVPKGGGVFFSGMTIHGSYGNRSQNRVRRAFATHFVADGTWVYRDDVQHTIAAV